MIVQAALLKLSVSSKQNNKTKMKTGGGCRKGVQQGEKGIKGGNEGPKRPKQIIEICDRKIATKIRFKYVYLITQEK